MFGKRWKFGITLFLFLCAALFSQPEKGSAEENKALQSAVLRSLDNMGYERLLIRDCMISFSRRVVPSEENNGYFAYTRFVNLRNIVGIENLSVKEFRINDYETFELRSDLRDSLESENLPIVFKAWVIEKFGQDLWPYDHPKFHDQQTLEVEYYLQAYQPVFKDWNRRVDYSAFGSATVFSAYFIMNYETPEPLEAFYSAILAYSRDKGCSGGGS